MQVCGLSITQELIHDFAVLFQLRSLSRLEAESTRLAMMGQHSLSISIIRQSLTSKRNPQPGELSDVVTHYASNAHIVSYLRRKLKQIDSSFSSDIAASKLCMIFYCFCQLSVESYCESERPDTLVFTQLDSIVAELIRHDPDDSAVSTVLESMTAIEVESYNNRSPCLKSHLFVKIPYMTGSGKQREIVCCPQCGTTLGCQCKNSETVHKGEVELLRTTKSAASRTKVIAMWSCCGTPIATTDTSVSGFRIEQEALKICRSYE